MVLCVFAIANPSLALEAEAQTNTNLTIEMAPPVATATLSTSGVVSHGATLRPGTVNADVKTLQAHLKNLGYYTLSVDGKYGPNTKHAVEKFQAAHNLKVDGVAGVKTFASLATAASADTVVTIPTLPSGPSADMIACPMVYKPVCGQPHVINCVKAPCPQPEPITYGNECMLSAAGGTLLYEGECKPSKYNDVVLHPVSTTGSATAATNVSATAIPTLSSNVHATLRKGSAGVPVATVQASLKNLGYYTGVIDGKFGAATEIAVRNYQQGKSLKVDGVIGVNTLSTIAADSLVAASASSTLSAQ